MSHSMTWSFRQFPLCLLLVLAVGSCTPDGEEKEVRALDRVPSGSKARMEREAGLSAAKAGEWDVINSPPTDGEGCSIMANSSSALKLEERDLIFSGKIIDHNEMPFAGAMIKYGVSRASDIKASSTNDDFEFGSAVSDSDGRFEIRKESVLAIQVMQIEKPGWTLVESRGRFGCSVRDNAKLPRIARGNPLVFMMMPEDRVIPKSIQKSVEFQWNREVPQIRLDDSGVLLNLHLKRDRRPGQYDGFDWSIEFSIEGGGIRKLHEEGLMLAPTEGYMPLIRYEARRDDPDWSASVDINLMHVYRTAAGEYGTLEIQFFASRDDDADSAIVTMYHNPTGERYLR